MQAMRDGEVEDGCLRDISAGLGLGRGDRPLEDLVKLAYKLSSFQPVAL